ncbi:hypothetical protein IE53DRAFT_279600 [Violaceomyces palustris]|uniref:Uncharacterized protein n=1 Tax=Violaceomyces palustris TaxID=1673888 RepID=A0ACD0NMD4_9BASI|nr:hypothetical protein IE53DRAFT_279600 [Violaceomyces palustris]
MTSLLSRIGSPILKEPLSSTPVTPLTSIDGGSQDRKGSMTSKLRKRFSIAKQLDRPDQSTAAPASLPQGAGPTVAFNGLGDPVLAQEGTPSKRKTVAGESGQLASSNIVNTLTGSGVQPTSDMKPSFSVAAKGDERVSSEGAGLPIIVTANRIGSTAIKVEELEGGGDRQTEFQKPEGPYPSSPKQTKSPSLPSRKDSTRSLSRGANIPTSPQVNSNRGQDRRSDSKEAVELEGKRRLESSKGKTPNKSPPLSPALDKHAMISPFTDIPAAGQTVMTKNGLKRLPDEDTPRSTSLPALNARGKEQEVSSKPSTSPLSSPRSTKDSKVRPATATGLTTGPTGHSSLSSVSQWPPSSRRISFAPSVRKRNGPAPKGIFHVSSPVIKIVDSSGNGDLQSAVARDRFIESGNSLISMGRGGAGNSWRKRRPNTAPSLSSSDGEEDGKITASGQSGDDEVRARNRETRMENMKNTRMRSEGQSSKNAGNAPSDKVPTEQAGATARKVTEGQHDGCVEPGKSPRKPEAAEEKGSFAAISDDGSDQPIQHVFYPGTLILMRPGFKLDEDEEKEQKDGEPSVSKVEAASKKTKGSRWKSFFGLTKRQRDQKDNGVQVSETMVESESVLEIISTPTQAVKALEDGGQCRDSTERKAKPKSKEDEPDHGGPSPLLKVDPTSSSQLSGSPASSTLSSILPMQGDAENSLNPSKAEDGGENSIHDLPRTPLQLPCTNDRLQVNDPEAIAELDPSGVDLKQDANIDHLNLGPIAFRDEKAACKVILTPGVSWSDETQRCGSEKEVTSGNQESIIVKGKDGADGSSKEITSFEKQHHISPEIVPTTPDGSIILWQRGPIIDKRKSRDDGSGQKDRFFSGLSFGFGLAGISGGDSGEKGGSGKGKGASKEMRRFNSLPCSSSSSTSNSPLMIGSTSLLAKAKNLSLLNTSLSERGTAAATSGNGLKVTRIVSREERLRDGGITPILLPPNREGVVTHPNRTHLEKL